MTNSELDVGMRCIKYMLFVTNFMFAMIGFLLISIGTTVNAIYSDFELFMDSSYFSPSALFIAIGIIMFFVSIFGCIGAFRQSVVLINIYSLLLFVILILEITAAICAYTMRGDVESFVEKRMNHTIANPTPESTQAWDFLQERLGCCGIHHMDDWQTISRSKEDYVPDSCKANEKLYTIYSAGCLDKLEYVITECAYLIGTGGVCVAIVQILGVIFASMLAKSVRRLKSESERQRQEERMRMYAQLAQGHPDQKPSPVIYLAPESQS